MRDTPISEAGFVGAGVGAAPTGLRPVLDVMWADFTGARVRPDLQPGREDAATCSAARRALPLTIRVAMGSGLAAAAQHSGTLYSIYTHLPGLKVVVPSTPYDAKGLLLEAIFDDGPVIVLRAPEALRRQGRRCPRSRTASRSARPTRAARGQRRHLVGDRGMVDARSRRPSVLAARGHRAPR